MQVGYRLSDFQLLVVDCQERREGVTARSASYPRPVVRYAAVSASETIPLKAIHYLCLRHNGVGPEVLDPGLLRG